MKRVWIYMATSLLAFGTLSCAPDDMDKELLASLRPTDPAFVAFSQSLKSVTLSAGALVTAQNLNEYIIAPEERKQRVEDLYFPYEKVREVGEGKWRIYSSSREENYQILNGLTLEQAGAEWLVVNDNRFFLTKEECNMQVPEGRLLLRSLSEDTHEIVLTDVTMCVNRGHRSLLSHIRADGNYFSRYGAVVVDGTFRVTSNNSAFRSGEQSHLMVQIEGSGEFRDASGAFYGVEIEITEPIVFEYNTMGFPVDTGVGAMALTIHTSPIAEEFATIEMSSNKTIAVTYEVDTMTKGGTYYWNE